MLAATLAVGVLFTLAPPQTFSDRIGSGLLAIVVLAAVGTLLQTPALFEIPLVLGLLFLGLDSDRGRRPRPPARPGVELCAPLGVAVFSGRT